MTQKILDTECSPIGRFLKSISTRDFLSLGKDDIAYIRPVTLEGRRSYAIHAADGTPLSVMDNYQEAIWTIKQNDMNAVTVH